MDKAYDQFLQKRRQGGSESGFVPEFMPDFLFDFQKVLVDHAVRKGKVAVFADCGLGKTIQQLVWAENVIRKNNKRVLLLTPLAVGAQTVEEARRFGIECARMNGTMPNKKIVVVNYEKLHTLDATDFAGLVCDESSILKHMGGATQKAVTRFASKMSYRSLWTATAAPNDYYELGTSSEALGYIGYSDMLTKFFVMDDKKRTRINDIKLLKAAKSGNHYARLAYRASQQIGAWRLKGHAEEPFWKWVCSWARACRKPSDLGFDDGRFVLPELVERDHIVTPRTPPNGMLFTMPAFGLKEERDERRRTLRERCELVARLVDHKRPAVVWCHFNEEGDLLEQMIGDSVQVKGADSDDKKEESYQRFKDGDARVMITKPKIGAWGLNWQHCNHVVTFASHSYEQFYQSVRRCWRFGQKKPVTVDIVYTVGEKYVRDNMIRKSQAADKMFTELVRHMNDAMHLKSNEYKESMEVPSWL